MEAKMLYQLAVTVAVVSVAVVSVLVSPVVAAPLRCDISTKYACNRDGCRPDARTIWNLVDVDRSRYSRCDSKGCDDLQMVQSASGIFLNIDVPGKGMLAKMSRDGSSFIEVVTLADYVLISFGSCH
jgi:hypothetical protein